jgi:hypothetical protein
MDQACGLHSGVRQTDFKPVDNFAVEMMMDH